MPLNSDDMPPNERRARNLSVEDIKYNAALAEQKEKAREYAMCMKVARRVANKLYAGRFQHGNGGRIAVWVWVWSGDLYLYHADVFSKALGELFKDSGLRVAGFNPGLFSITVIFDGLTP